MTVAPDNWVPASDELAGKTILVTLSLIHISEPTRPY